jgi:NAD+ diphosphatase
LPSEPRIPTAPSTPLELSRRNPFTGLALDRRDEWRVDAGRISAGWASARIVAVDFEGRARGSDAGLAVIAASDLAADALHGASFLGVQDEQPWFALPASSLPDAMRDDAAGWFGLREAAARWSAFESGLFAYSKALLLWQSRARHCGACGAPTVLKRAGHCARCSNVDCGLEQYPRTDAAIIVIVTDGRRGLLGRQRGWPAGRYSTLAGFVEPGESLEDAVRREVREEAGVLVGECSYQSSQPWPFPGALMVGFRARASDARIVLGDELEDARWFDADELVASVVRGEMGLPPAISVSRRLIEDWLVDTVGADCLPKLRAADIG